VSRADGLQQLTKGWAPGLADAFREDAAMKSDIDEAMGTQPAVRGATSTVGRVSATEHQARLQQALLRQKQYVVRLEGEMRPMVQQLYMLWYQLGDERVRVRIGGTETPGDPIAEMQREDFLEALDIDIGFRGGSRAINRETQAAQLRDLIGMASSLEVAPGFKAMFPEEFRVALKRMLEALGVKGVQELISDSRTKEATEAFKVVEISNAMQIAQASMMAQRMAMGIPPPQPGGDPAQGAASGPPGGGGPPPVATPAAGGPPNDEPEA